MTCYKPAKTLQISNSNNCKKGIWLSTVNSSAYFLSRPTEILERENICEFNKLFISLYCLLDPKTKCYGVKWHCGVSHSFLRLYWIIYDNDSEKYNLVDTLFYNVRGCIYISVITFSVVLYSIWLDGDGDGGRERKREIERGGWHKAALCLK